MKLKNYFELMGLRQSARHYGYALNDFNVGGNTVRYAQWQHPKETDKELTDAMVQAYRAHVRPGDFCIDIGAHTGDSTLPMALAATASGCVLAMEPNPFVFHVLQKNARENAAIANIDCMLAAVAPEEGFIEFEYSDAGFCNGGRHEDISPLAHGHAYKQEVFAVNLVSELERCYSHRLPQLSFVKVDAEGFDLYILKAIEPILREYRPAIKAEVYQHADDSYRKEMLGFFDGLGYDVFRIVGEPIEPGPRLEEGMMAEPRHFDLLAVAAAGEQKDEGEHTG